MASHYYAWRTGDVHYLKRGLGDPLLLVHNIYPGASHEEYAHNLDELARHFTVYAIDLPGFGDSSAPRRKYTAGLYVELIADFVREVIGAPAHAMSAGLSCAYVTAAAAREWDRFGRLVFVCPRSEPTGLDLPRWVAPIRHFMLSAPGLGRGYYETVAGEYAIRQYLGQCFYRPRAVTPDLVHRLHDNAMRPGSINAYAGLLTGYLDHPLLADLPRVNNPLMLLWGRQARPTPVEHSVRLLALAKDCRLEVVEDAGSWVHDEQSAKVDRLVVQYLNDELPASATTQARTA
jgi:pimeloyl-ACP methyl ester carboxylesterase